MNPPRTVQRARVRLLRSWWTLAIPIVAVGFLLLWCFGQGLLASIGSSGCIASLAVLLLVVTVSLSESNDDGESAFDTPPKKRDKYDSGYGGDGSVTDGDSDSGSGSGGDGGGDGGGGGGGD